MCHAYSFATNPTAALAGIADIAGTGAKTILGLGQTRFTVEDEKVYLNSEKVCPVVTRRISLGITGVEGHFAYTKLNIKHDTKND